VKGLGFGVSATTVGNWLRKAGLAPAGRRGGVTWREFVRAHRRRLLAVDFFMPLPDNVAIYTVETVWFQRLYVMFFIELGSRRVRIVGCTPNPTRPIFMLRGVSAAHDCTDILHFPVRVLVTQAATADHGQRPMIPDRVLRVPWKVNRRSRRIRVQIFSLIRGRPQPCRDRQRQ
jgi:hypothetical protein